ncbi:hypothetical protein [Desulfonauticus submarinus]
MDNLSTILSSGIFGVIIGVILKTWFTERLSQSIKHEYDKELENFKNKLQIEAYKRNIEYSRIHEKRLEIISELAGKMYSLHQALTQYVSVFEWEDGPTKKERRKMVVETLGDFLKFYRPKKLFLPENTVEKIDSFIKRLNDTAFKFMRNVEYLHELEEDEIKKSIDIWVESDKFAVEEIPNPSLSLFFVTYCNY